MVINGSTRQKNFLTSVASGIPIPSVADMIVKTFTKQIIRKFIIQLKNY